MITVNSSLWFWKIPDDFWFHYFSVKHGWTTVSEGNGLRIWWTRNDVSSDVHPLEHNRLFRSRGEISVIADNLPPDWFLRQSSRRKVNQISRNVALLFTFAQNETCFLVALYGRKKRPWELRWSDVVFQLPFKLLIGQFPFMEYRSCCTLRILFTLRCVLCREHLSPGCAHFESQTDCLTTIQSISPAHFERGGIPARWAFAIFGRRKSDTSLPSSERVCQIRGKVARRYHSVGSLCDRTEWSSLRRGAGSLAGYCDSPQHGQANPCTFLTTLKALSHKSRRLMITNGPLTIRPQNSIEILLVTNNL